MRVAIASDHAGFDLKEELRAELEKRGIEVEDLGAYSTESVDYPLQAEKVGRRVARGDAERGLLVCGTGVGMAIAANKIAGVRAANCFDPYVASMSRSHNDANVLTLGSRIVGSALALAILDAFLETSFEGDRHGRRVDQIRALETH